MAGRETGAAGGFSRETPPFPAGFAPSRKVLASMRWKKSFLGFVTSAAGGALGARAGLSASRQSITVW